MSNLNQKQFDQKFTEIALTEKVRGMLKEHATDFGDLPPMKTTIGSTCNHCEKDADTNALYEPAHNAMHWRCPSCFRTNRESNWFDYGGPSGMKHYETGEPITRANISKHVGPPEPSYSLPAPSIKEVQSKSWDREGEILDKVKPTDPHQHEYNTYDPGKKGTCIHCNKDRDSK
jgi:hypothetical protein